MSARLCIYLGAGELQARDCAERDRCGAGVDAKWLYQISNRVIRARREKTGPTASHDRDDRGKGSLALVKLAEPAACQPARLFRGRRGGAARCGGA
ncbi:hypothetical protein L1887_53378 [Cichorium endivia]|nr:hypothetical protein L1887_53378 [Cichorium endivia]